jgi:hypothetical protein
MRCYKRAMSALSPPKSVMSLQINDDIANHAELCKHDVSLEKFKYLRKALSPTQRTTNRVRIESIHYLVFNTTHPPSMATKTNLDVVFGCMTFGREGEEQVRTSNLEECAAILDTFQSHGHTEVDTSRFYGVCVTSGLTHHPYMLTSTTRMAHQRSTSRNSTGRSGA